MAEYIEREALLKWALDSMDAQRGVVGKAYCAEFARAIRQVKAADVAPVVRGRWEEWWPPKHMILTGEEMLYRCSVCDAKYSDKENMRYCPHCGARMDGE